MSVGKSVLLGLKISGAALALIMLAVIIANAFDRPLSAETRAFVERPLPSVPDEQNLFHALIGYTTISADPAENADFRMIGTRMRTAWLQVHKSGGGPLEFPHASGDTSLSFVGDKTELCKPPANGVSQCLAFAAEHRETITKLLDDNAEILRRYHQLGHYPEYVFDIPVSPAGPLPAMGPLFEGQSLAPTEIALLFAHGKTESAIENLPADLAFWRCFLQAKHGFLIEKMVAAAGYRNSVELLGEILRSLMLTPTEYAVLQSAIAPLPADILSMKSVLESEFEFQSTFVVDLGEPPETRPGYDASMEQSFGETMRDKLFRYFFQPQATLNRGYRRLQGAITTYSKSCGAIRATPAAEPALSGLDYLYNPSGNILMMIGAPSYASYIYRLCDLDGLNRVANLQLAIHEQAIAAPAIEEFVKAADARFKDPYTGQPMTWNAAGGLSFDASDPRMKALLPWPI